MGGNVRNKVRRGHYLSLPSSAVAITTATEDGKATDSKPNMFYTYILKNSVTGRYYIGFTPDLKKRLQKHLSGQVLSTKSNLNYHLEWYCAFISKDQALSFEKYLKTGSGIAFMKKRFFKYSVSVAVEKNGGG